MTAAAPQVDVAIVGAGFAGLGMATHLARRARESFVVLERADAVGGTWRDNIYPGIACDIPGHLYSFSFRPPADWSAVYPAGAEIRAYLDRLVHDEGLADHIRLGRELASATWDAEGARWHLVTEGGDGAQSLTARILLLAVGRLSEPRIPDIEGLDDFPGTVVHTAAWEPDLDLAGARVGVVGTGASAIQIVPHVAARAAELVIFSRTPPYIVPREDRRLDPAERAELVDPQRAAAHRNELLRNADAAFAQRLRRRPDIDEIRARALTHLRAQIPDPVLRAELTPDYEIGCKRILLSDDFYPTLLRENVVFEPGALESVVEAKARASSGRSHELDILVMATGFEAARPPVATRVHGRDDELLADHWRHGMVSYASTVVAGFPNMFVLDGPNAALGHNSAIYMIETQLDYVVGALDHMAEAGVAALEVTADAEAAYTREIDDRSSDTVWLTGCDSWYVDPESGRLTLLWPGTALSFRERNGTFEPEPFVTRSTVATTSERGE
ncbi:FAD-dependent pyridine nucleotide-disulfide oxidoreductase [Gordonia polyisoprenivorans VH2]|uniref:FAD-dependent pyridine nucleotide-disulfide oxidoreductase n=2 Tax=Gordonia TaxID=2053 RepID=H6MWD3_GORPV|nr:NAD(P)/FAD-dependent oxidoreductase [Gordonia polyisoprenivorans]AFA74138.1 FAD-dependent pyridine nucleotide-disulfide oxidoreductase [Gordonia polyisoprenivorans VH2]